jgi:hypothetical protein
MQMPVYSLRDCVWDARLPPLVNFPGDSIARVVEVGQWAGLQMVVARKVISIWGVAYCIR